MHVPFHARPVRALTVAVLMLAVAAACSRDNRAESSGEVTPGAAAPTPTVSTLRVADIEIGRAVSNARVTDATNELRATDTVYASVHTTGSAPSATLMARWTFQDGQVVEESSQAIAPTGDAYTEFHISKPDGLPKGKYKVEVFVDNQSAGTREFEVK